MGVFRPGELNKGLQLLEMAQEDLMIYRSQLDGPPPEQFNLALARIKRGHQMIAGAFQPRPEPERRPLPEPKKKPPSKALLLWERWNRAIGRS